MESIQGKDIHGDWYWLRVNSDGSIATQTSVDGSQLGDDITIEFANEAGANTQKTTDITTPESPFYEYEFVIYNPGATDVTVKLFNKEVFGEDTRYAYVTSFVVPKSQAVTGTTINTYAAFVNGLFCGGDVRMVISNNDAVAADGGFTMSVRIRGVR
jgi:hypothetical protein